MCQICEREHEKARAAQIQADNEARAKLQAMQEEARQQITWRKIEQFYSPSGVETPKTEGPISRQELIQMGRDAALGFNLQPFTGQEQPITLPGEREEKYLIFGRDGNPAIMVARNHYRAGYFMSRAQEYVSRLVTDAIRTQATLQSISMGQHLADCPSALPADGPRFRQCSCHQTMAREALAGA